MRSNMLQKKRSSPGPPKKSSLFSLCPFPPIAVIAICLLLSQLVVLNIVVIVFRGKSITTADKSGFDLGSSTTIQKQHKFDGEFESNDGTFNGYPMVFRKDQTNIETRSHCVGENYQDETSWQKRSCEFSELFCFDVEKKEYAVFDRAENERIYTNAESEVFVDISQSFLKKHRGKANTMSLGGINLKWGKDISRLEWFPEIRIVPEGESLSYYELPPNVIMIPFHSMNGGNPGHLVWDDFLPIYNLLNMYQLMDESNELMPMRYVLKGEGDDGSRGLWASCDWNDEKKTLCKTMFKKFLPLMLGSNPIHEELATTENFDFEPKGTAKSNLVCAKHAVAGFGPLTDHGTFKLHGWEDNDYKQTQNHGRGGLLYSFRNFMLTNLGIPTEVNQQPPFRIIFSENSSSVLSRNHDFTKQKELLKQSFHPSYVSVESYVFSEMSLKEQLEIASQASIFITTCGGGAVTSMFMPRGSSVIMYYLEDGGIVANKRNNKPARLDYDLFNNLAYLKVHWLPAGTMKTDYDIKALFLLIQHELEGLIRERSYDHFFS